MNKKGDEFFTTPTLMWVILGITALVVLIFIFLQLK